MELEEYRAGKEIVRYLDLYGEKLYIPEENFKSWTTNMDSVEMTGDDGIKATRPDIEVVLRVDTIVQRELSVRELIKEKVESIPNN